MSLVPRLFILLFLLLGQIGNACCDEINHRATRLLDLTASGGYLRSDWRKMQREIENIPPAEFPETAAAILASGRPANRGSVLDELVFVWAQTDPEAALTFADTLPDRVHYQTAFRGWAETNWKTAKAWLDRQPRGDLRDRLTASLLERVAVRDAREALRLLAVEFAEGRDPATWHVMSICATREPTATAEAWKDFPVGQEKNQARDALARYWGQHQPEAAWVWATALPGDNDRKKAQEGIARGLAEIAPAEAARLVGQSPERDGLQRLIANVWGEKEPEAAVRWALTLPAATQASVLGAILSRSGVKDPESLLTKMWSLPASKDRDGTISRLIQQWSKKDLPAVKKWALNPPGEADRRIVLLSLSRPLVEKDPELLLALLAQISEGPERKNVLISIRSVVSEIRPDLLPRLGTW